MITEETLAGALRTGDSRISLGGGWFSNGYFAARAEGLAATADETKPSPIEKWATMARTPVTEDVFLRIPFVGGKERCTDCVLGTCECACGNKHECESCDGDGSIDTVDDVGQMVFVGEGGTTIVHPLLGALLEGLTVVRVPDPPGQPAPLSALLGFDDKGELVAAVMPLRKTVRKPETQASL